MCSKTPKIQTVTPAATVSAPVETNTTNVETEGTKRRKKAAGKKNLVVGSGSGTGVNI